MKQTKKKVENKKCFCGEIDIILELKNSEIEINGIRHSIYGCYEMKQTIEKCLQCPKKLPKAYVQMDFKKFCSMKCMEKYYDKWEMMINRMKAVEARVKRLEEESESVEYIVPPPKNNGLVKEKNESFIKRLLNNIKALKPQIYEQQISLVNIGHTNIFNIMFIRKIFF